MKTPSPIIITTAFIISCFSTVINSAEITVDQQDKQFMQGGQLVEKISINVGDKVHFKNQDPWFHNVFSLSDISTFDLGSYEKGKSKAVTFDKAGIAEVECAIHPSMFIEIEVK